MDDLQNQLADIRAEPDPNRRNLRVAALVSMLFREAGADPVVVGGSAVEVYTDGQYVSGDVGLCFAGAKVPTPRRREEIMASVGRRLSTRKWEVAGVMVEVLGSVETTARTAFQEIGPVKLIQIEDLIAERVLAATYPQPDAGREEVARTLLAVALAGGVTLDLDELHRVADSPDYRVGGELRRLLAGLQSKQP